jgi:tetratricopeptide (TPR) repeat protein
VNKQQILLVGGGIVVFCLIYFFGNTTPEKKPHADTEHRVEAPVQTIDFNTILSNSKQNLTPSQLELVNTLENNLQITGNKEGKIEVYRQLASFWRDTAHMLIPYAFYSGEAAKLENSEKSLTFAAQFFIDGARLQGEPAKRNFMADEARKLFEQALELNPGNDSLKVGLGSCYLVGEISDNPMKGISLIREVVERDPENMYAQLVLARGGMVSGQFDKAIERLNVIVQKQPENLEAIIMLAEAYERHGEKENAVKWYKTSLEHLDHPEVLEEVKKKIEFLSK